MDLRLACLARERGARGAAPEAPGIELPSTSAAPPPPEGAAAAGARLEDGAAPTPSGGGAESPVYATPAARARGEGCPPVPRRRGRRAATEPGAAFEPFLRAGGVTEGLEPLEGEEDPFAAGKVYGQRLCDRRAFRSDHADCAVAGRQVRTVRWTLVLAPDDQDDEDDEDDEHEAAGPQEAAAAAPEAVPCKDPGSLGRAPLRMPLRMPPTPLRRGAPPPPLCQSPTTPVAPALGSPLASPLSCCTPTDAPKSSWRCTVCPMAPRPGNGPRHWRSEVQEAAADMTPASLRQPVNVWPLPGEAMTPGSYVGCRTPGSLCLTPSGRTPGGRTPGDRFGIASLASLPEVGALDDEGDDFGFGAPTQGPAATPEPAQTSPSGGGELETPELLTAPPRRLPCAGRGAAAALFKSP